MKVKIAPIAKITEKHLELLLDADPNKKLVTSYIKRGECFQGVIQDEIVAVLCLLPSRPETLEIVNIAVDSKWQNQGFGRQLIAFGLAYARNNHYQTVEIGTGTTSFSQLALYQKCGFRLIAIDHNFFIRHYEEIIIENGIVLKDMVRLSHDV